MRKEVFKGEEVRGAHRSGTELAAATILGYSVAAYALYIMMPNVLTGQASWLPIACGRSSRRQQGIPNLSALFACFERAILVGHLWQARSWG